MEICTIRCIVEIAALFTLTVSSTEGIIISDACFVSAIIIPYQSIRECASEHNAAGIDRIGFYKGDTKLAFVAKGL